MKNRGWLAAIVALVMGIFCAMTPARAQNKHDHFDDHDRQVARDWYHNHHDAFIHTEGKYWHQDWEPNIREGFVLTPDMRAAIQPVPVDLEAQLGPVPDGYRYVVIGDHVCLIDNGFRIHDVLHFELNF